MSSALILTGCPSQKVNVKDVEPTPIEAFNPNIVTTELSGANSDSERLSVLFSHLINLEDHAPQLLHDALETFNPVFLSATDRARYHFLQAVSYHSLGDNQRAAQLLLDLNEQWLSNQAVDTKLIIYSYSNEIFERAGRRGYAAKSLFYACSLLPTEHCDERIIQLLTETNASALSSLSDDNPNWNRWIELAQLLTDMSRPMPEQGAAISQWIDTHHTTFFFAIPNSVQLLIDISALPQPRTAVLIPLTGRFSVYGKAIRDGYIAGYFHETSGHSNRASIDFYDSNVDDITTLYLALTERYDLIIGPLEKSKVTEVASVTSETPTLLLNTRDDNVIRDHLYYFGLDLKHEAVEAAQQAFTSGLKHPLLILPNNSANQDFSDQFLQTWEVLTSGNEEYSQPTRLSLTVASQYSNEIADGFGITASNARAREIGRTLGTSVEAEPRRREDIDSIILSATPSEARQLNPLIKYHHGENLTVFASSRAFPGLNQPEINQDLDNILIELPPWAIYDTEAATQIREYSSNDTLLQNLFALGFDGFALGSRLNYLDVVSSARASGETGQLSIDEQNSVTRRLFWGQFRGDQLVPITQ